MAFQRIYLITLVLFYTHFANVQSTTSNSLSDCQSVASSFRSTINYTASNITATTGVNVTCSQTMICPGQTINGVCVWQRKLSAVCRNASGTIKIRIQTNGLPPRCADVPMGTFAELNVDFEVNFNPSVSVNSLNQNFSSMSTLSQAICTLTTVSTVPTASGFVNYGATLLNTATGVSVDGVMIFSPDSANNIDPFYPPANGSAESVDACLAHCQVAGVYHYHIATSCQVNPPTGNITSCASTPSCSSSVSTYSISSFSSYQTKTVIGLAKDGHVIYGPYLSSGTRVTSGFDACNGMFYDSNGNYAYFATSTYPYLVGCFGPANYPSFGPNCTTNGPSNYTMSSYALALLSNSTNSTTTTTTTTSTSTTSTSTTTTTSKTTTTTTSASSSNSTTTASSSNSTTTTSSSNSTTTTARRSSSMAIQFNLNIFLLLFTFIAML